MPDMVLQLDPTYPPYAADARLYRQGQFGIGVHAVSANPLFLPRQPNADIGHRITGDSSASLMITATPMVLEDRYIEMLVTVGQANIIGEIAEAVDKGAIIVTVGGVPLTSRQIVNADYPEHVEQDAGVVAVNGEPTLASDGEDVSDSGAVHFVAYVTAGVENASFRPWGYINGAWIPLDAASAALDSYLYSASTEQSALMERAYLEVSAHVAGTWTLEIVRVR